MKLLVIAAVGFAAVLPNLAAGASQTEKSCIAGCRRTGGDLNACVAANNCAQYRKKPAAATSGAPAQKPVEYQRPKMGDY